MIRNYVRLFGKVPSSSCPFQVLGLRGSKRSSVDPISYEQVRVAFRDLAFKHHPDTSKSDDSGTEFIRITAAFEAIEEDDTGMAVVRGNRPYIDDEHETSTNQNEKKKYSPSSQEQFLHSSLDPQILRELHDVANKLNPGGLDKGGFWAYANMIGRMSLTDLPPLRVDSGNDASTYDKGADKVKTRRKRK